MEIEFTPEQKSFVHLAIEEGRLKRPEDAVKDALALWEERERARLELLAEIDAGERALDAGEGTIYDSSESIRELGEAVKRRGGARLAGQ